MRSVLTGQFAAGPAQQGSASALNIGFPAINDERAYGVVMPGSGAAPWTLNGQTLSATLSSYVDPATHGALAKCGGMGIPAGATVTGVTVSFSAGIVQFPLKTIGATLVVSNLGLINSTSVRSADKAPNTLLYQDETPIPYTPTLTYGGPTDTWGMGPALNAAYVNDSSFAMDAVLAVRGTSSIMYVDFTPVSITVWYFMPVGLGSVLYDQALINGGWTKGDGRVQLVVLPLGTFKGVILGYSLKWTGYMVETVLGAIHGKLGNVYAGIVRQPQSVAMSGWGSFVPNLFIVNKIWDAETDSPFPLLIAPGPPPQVVPDIRLSSFEFPQPLEVAEDLSMGIGIWLAPSLGPVQPGGNPTLTAWALGVSSCSYTIQLDGEEVTPRL